MGIADICAYMCAYVCEYMCWLFEIVNLCLCQPKKHGWEIIILRQKHKKRERKREIVFFALTFLGVRVKASGEAGGLFLFLFVLISVQ